MCFACVYAGLWLFFQRGTPRTVHVLLHLKEPVCVYVCSRVRVCVYAFVCVCMS